MVKKVAIAMIVTVSSAAWTTATEPFKSPEARRALATYKDKIKDASAEFKAKMEEAREAYEKTLRDARAKIAAKNDDKDDAEIQRISDELRDLSKGGNGSVEAAPTLAGPRPLSIWRHFVRNMSEPRNLVLLFSDGKAVAHGFNGDWKLVGDTYTVDWKNTFIDTFRVSMEEGKYEGRNNRNEALRGELIWRELQPQKEADGGARVRIPREAKPWNGHRYLVVDEAVTWHVAKLRCEAAGGHLLRIESGEEQKFIEKLLANTGKRSWYMDGSDEDAEGQWQFSDRRLFQYTNWGPQEPGNVGGELEHSAAIAADGQFGYPHGKWIDLACYFRTGFICEWDQ
jgi:hypothetical protein